MQKKFISIAGISGAISVALGAMGAHFLKSKVESGALPEAGLQAFETAVRYQVFHSIALLIVALMMMHLTSVWLKRAGWCFIAGIIMFSGSVYFLSLSPLLGNLNLRWLGPVTPMGGLFFITGWLFIAIAGLQKTNQH